MEGIGVTLPAGVLQQDSAIIDEQDSYLVLTVRVSKETIRKNHALLMALSDLTSEAPWSPAADPPPMAKKRKTQLGPYAAVTLLALAIPLMFYTNSFARNHPLPPPLEHESVRLAKPTFKVGEDIDVVFHYRRDRACLSTFDRSVRRIADGATVFSTRIYGQDTQPTAGEFRDYHAIVHPPSPLPPGEYFYTGLTHSECANGGTYDLPHPRLAFTVTR